MSSDRKRLKKLLGKVCVFQATKQRTKGTDIMFKDVYHKNKLVTDHIWCSSSYGNQTIKEGETVFLKATVETYVDSYGTRKYGLGKFHKFQAIEMLQEQKDTNQKIKRLYK